MLTRSFQLQFQFFFTIYDIMEHLLGDSIIKAMNRNAKLQQRVLKLAPEGHLEMTVMNKESDTK